MEQTKSIQINNELHTEVKKYCSDNGLKLQKFVEKLIKDGLYKNIQSNMSKSKK
jgi:predicted DNA binding CopG/RHH family protein